MMSKASASTALVLVPEIGTFNQYLLCNKGDLWQNYEGSASAPTKVTPDFAVTRPVLWLMVTSSRVSGTETPDAVRFYLGAVLIGTVSRAGSTYSKTLTTDAAYSGMFELISPADSGSGGNYGLRIKKNLVAATGGDSGQFRAEFDISEGTSMSTLQATCPFNISEVTENSSMVVIESGDNFNFQITKNNTSVILAAKFFRGLNEVTTGITYKWFKQVYGANPTGGTLANWQELTGQTGPTLTVQEADVDTSQRYMVHVLDSTGTTVLGQDTQTVFDASDLYEVVMARMPEDGQVHRPGDQITVSCSVYRRGNTTPVVLPAGALWAFVGATPAGTSMFTQAASTSKICTIGYQDIYDAGGQLELTATVEF